MLVIRKKFREGAKDANECEGWVLLVSSIRVQAQSYASAVTACPSNGTIGSVSCGAPQVQIVLFEWCRLAAVPTAGLEDPFGAPRNDDDPAKGNEKSAIQPKLNETAGGLSAALQRLPSGGHYTSSTLWCDSPIINIFQESNDKAIQVPCSLSAPVVWAT